MTKTNEQELKENIEKGMKTYNIISNMMNCVEFVYLLKSKKTGKYYCPICKKELKDKDVCWECNKCRKYYGKSEEDLK